jgi:hypothetical protein
VPRLALRPAERSARFLAFGVVITCTLVDVENAWLENQGSGISSLSIARAR